MNKSSLKRICENHHIPDFRYYEETDSTNLQALSWSLKGAPEYAFVIADAQTAGRGRSGRKWITTPEASIAVSFILYPAKPELDKLGLFSLLGGLSVQSVLEENYHISAQVKWPNDVLIHKKKTAGILAETAWAGDELNGLVLGIGINLLPSSVPPDDEVIFPATCVANHSDHAVQQENVLSQLIEKLIKLRQSMLQQNFIDKYVNKMAFKNQHVVLDAGEGKTESGLLRGIDPYGKIILESANNELNTYPIGDLRLRPE